MKNIISVSLMLMAGLTSACISDGNGKGNEKDSSDVAIESVPQQNDDCTYVLLSTEYGDIKIKLYNETPKHRDNFIKLVSEGYYDGTLFHRVIKDFMVQGGDPDSKNAQPEQILGNGGPGYTIPAEFNSKLFHKKGALAAARQGDDVNPEKASSGSQFYIVQGQVTTVEMLDQIKAKMNFQTIQMAINKKVMSDSVLLASVKSLQAADDQDGLKELIDEVSLLCISDIKKTPLTLAEVEKLTDEEKAEIKSYEMLTFTQEQIDAYTTIGGTPFLDGNYTVFGEVVKGLDVIDKIAVVETDGNNRPKMDIKMTMKIVK